MINKERYLDILSHITWEYCKEIKLNNSVSECLYRLSLHPNPEESATQIRRKSPPPDRSEATLVF